MRPFSPALMDRDESGLAPSASAAAPAKMPQAHRARGLSYRRVLVLSFAAVVVLTGLSITFFAHARSTSTTSRLAQQVFAEVTDRAAVEAEAFLGRAPPVGDTLAALIVTDSARHDQRALARQLLSVLITNQGLTWVSYSDTAGAFTGAYRTATGTLRTNLSHIENGETRLQEFDIADDGEWVVFRNVQDSGYDPRTRPFYVKAIAAGGGTWSEPYLFYDQGVPGISYSRPVFDETGALLGVISVDFDLNLLSDLARRLKFSPSAHLVIFAADGTVLGHPRASGGALSSVASDSARLARIDEVGDPLAAQLFGLLKPQDLAATPQRPIAQRLTLAHGGESYYGATTAFAPGGDLVWVVGAIAPTRDFLGDVQQSQRITLVLALCCVIAAMLVGTILARRVSGPILSLVAAMRRIGGGDFEGEARIESATLEFRALSEALNRMVRELREGVRARASLAIATQIQQELLPAAPPTVPGLDIAGHSSYSEETGGDYYDYLLPRMGAQATPSGEGQPRTLLVVCGDVTGHGIGSALLMAGARAVLRSHVAETHASLGKLLERVNESLHADTGGRRFMTMFLAAIDADTGTIRYCSAGHDPPIAYDADRDFVRQLEGGNLPLGVIEGTCYQEFSAQLAPGEVICVGTDGVWEAARGDGEMFGKERLREAIRASASGSAADIEAEVSRRLSSFLGAARPKDDVTFLVIKRQARR